VHQFTHRPDDRDLAGHFNILHSQVESCCRITGECIRNCPTLPKLPGLIGNDYYAGLIHLVDFCAEAARRLCADPTAAPKTRKSDTINGYILEALATVPEAEKRQYQKGAAIYTLVKAQHPTLDRALRTFEGYLTALAKNGKLEHKQGPNGGYRLPQK
jgi:hypothetical protein